jgi:hypothetical protein
MLFRPPNSLISFRDVYERRESLAPLGGRLFQREKAGTTLGESGKNLAQPGTFSPAGRSDEISCKRLEDSVVKHENNQLAGQ